MQEKISTSDTPNAKPRRSYTREFKARIIAECDAGDKSVAQVAMSHQINANLIHNWRRRMKQGGARQAMVPVALSAPAPSRCEGPGHIEVALDTATVRFYGTVDSHNARTLLSVLR